MDTTELLKQFHKRPRPKVFFPLPSYDWRGDVASFYSLMETLGACHLELDTHCNMQDGVARARNCLAHHFLHHTDNEFLFWTALDIKWNAGHVETIMAKMVMWDLDICGGLYAGKGPHLKWIYTSLDKNIKADPRTGLLAAKHAGTDFLCIRRRVFEKIAKDRPDLVYNFKPSPDVTEQHVNFHPMPIHDGELESEDWAFCRLARESGFKVWVDSQTVVEHRGNIYFPLFLTLTDAAIAEIVKCRYRFDLPAALNAAKAQDAPALTISA